MFGHQDDQNDHHQHHDDQQLGNILSEPAVDGVLEAGDQTGAPTMGDDFNPALPTSDSDQPGSTVTPHDDDAVAAPVPVDTSTDTPPAAPANSDLLDIKQQALTELSPLVGHLNQSPEEKFRTTMMMIQASDNQDLIKTAYEAAQAIDDEKVKAQALLDIVNEINYFTSHHA